LVTNYQPKLSNIPSGRKPQLHCDGSVESRKVALVRRSCREVDNIKIGCKLWILLRYYAYRIVYYCTYFSECPNKL